MPTLRLLGYALGTATLLTGCIKIDIAQTIEADGSARVVLNYDVSELQKTEEEINKNLNTNPRVRRSSSSSSRSGITGCDSFLKESPPPKEITNIECVDTSEYSFRLTADQKLPRRMFVIRKANDKTVYLYRIQNANALVESNLSKKSDPTAEEAEMGEELARSIIQGTFTLTMPGKIIVAPGGVISGNTVTYDIHDLAKQKRRMIQAVK